MKTEWISVKDRLPEVGVDVLTFNPSWERLAVLCWLDSAARFGNEARWDDSSGDSYQDYQPTHWQPLPPPPEDESS